MTARKPQAAVDPAQAVARRCQRVASDLVEAVLDDLVWGAARWSALTLSGDPYGSAMDQLRDAYRARLCRMMPQVRQVNRVTFCAVTTQNVTRDFIVGDAWDVGEAWRLKDRAAGDLGARPTWFQFTELLVADPVEVTGGHVLEVVGRQVRASGRYFMGGAVTIGAGRRVVALAGETHVLEGADVVLDESGRPASTVAGVRV